MLEYTRVPQDVVGTDPILLAYWDQIPDAIQRYLLSSDLRIATLGELELMCQQLLYLVDEPPAIF